ncbi:predicted protein [Naegleria gruberi]|uniref:Predicted protein n=1 Tax=Naegleria gruberi TaxID=5762 RepID=D2W1D5_NAEGR|nr:uncharacterized protein NAEGRDRAFT_75178 [Naegleria gruberi]EFC37029.1 predicted protein [Naegleria gruberi]|eukprot:XP_002669773.1 predicted protein [Naegleria gruberi strain NEG-M]
MSATSSSSDQHNDTSSSSDNNLNNNLNILNNLNIKEEYKLPSLIEFNNPLFKEIHYGPTDTSNWLIPNRILMSAYPGDLNLEKSKIKISQLLKSGINCFVCLQLKEELNRFIPYKPLIEEYCLLNNLNINNFTYLHLEIPDNYVTSDEKVMNFINQELLPQIKKEESKCLIHCWGGHGRTGTISSILLSHLYQLNSQQALERVAKVHSCRIIRKSRAPQSPSQFKQVKRLSFGYIKNSDDDSDDYDE